MPNPRSLAVILAIAALTCQITAAEEARSRKFHLRVSTTLTGVPTDAKVRVWLPIPQDSYHQDVLSSLYDVPSPFSISQEPKYGNSIGHFQTKADGNGQVTFATAHLIRRHEIRGLDSPLPTKLEDDEKQLALAGLPKIPIGGKPAELLTDQELPDDEFKLARKLYDVVQTHMQYDKSRPGYGTGDAVWACDSRFGNCTDFHSLFMSLARTKGLPAEFEMGFPLPAKRGEGVIGGYHCWAFFHTADHGWLPVDISEADKDPTKEEYFFGNLDENRATFTRGRDFPLVPKAAAGKVNYLIYPHIEVDGKPWPKEKTKHTFQYADR